MNVRKNDGSLQEFDSEKIKRGICEAFASVGEVCNDGLIEALIKNLFMKDVLMKRFRRISKDRFTKSNGFL